jgi:hypothetical protein
MLQTPIRNSVLSFCSASDISLLQALDYISLSDAECRRYLNPVRDLSTCNWILERIESKDMVTLVGKDIEPLLLRIQDPLAYYDRYKCKQNLIVWVAVVPVVSIPDTEHAVLVDQYTRRVFKRSNEDFMSMQAELHAATGGTNPYHDWIDRACKRNDPFATVFTLSPDVLKCSLDGEHGWMQKEICSDTGVQVIEYYGKGSILVDPNPNLYACIGHYTNYGVNLIGYTGMAQNADPASMFVHYIQLHVDPFVSNMVRGHAHGAEYKEGVLGIQVNYRSDESPHFDKRTCILSIPLE